ncbi:hypothetical protein H4Q26_005828 [Puccinia striiformis f. sp. tritici PST-130]|nr:hypothetical protein H4Q26_005828 [Puccinia striiformis f. sp. tritici PST-130]
MVLIAKEFDKTLLKDVPRSQGRKNECKSFKVGIRGQLSVKTSVLPDQGIEPILGLTMGPDVFGGAMTKVKGDPDDDAVFGGKEPLPMMKEIADVP